MSRADHFQRWPLFASGFVALVLCLLPLPDWLDFDPDTMTLSRTDFEPAANAPNARVQITFTPDPVFGVHVPNACPGVPAGLLQPRSTWKEPGDYDMKARQLAKLFQENFEKYAAKASADVKAAGPQMEIGRAHV